MIAVFLAAALSVGDKAPLFVGPLYNEDRAGTPSFSLEDWLEAADTKAILVSFFATWCEPCKKELPSLQQLSADYKDKGVRVVAVSVDREEAASAQIQELIRISKLTFPVIKDPHGLIAREYLRQATILPSVFLIDSTGTITFVKQSASDSLARARARLDELLRR